jgi:hypothetical protein
MIGKANLIQAIHREGGLNGKRGHRGQRACNRISDLKEILFFVLFGVPGAHCYTLARMGDKVKTIVICFLPGHTACHLRR